MGLREAHLLTHILSSPYCTFLTHKSSRLHSCFNEKVASPEAWGLMAPIWRRAAFTAVTPRNRLRREEGDGQFRDVRVRSVGSGSDEDKGGETAI